jgi:hypothetical protein
MACPTQLQGHEIVLNSCLPCAHRVNRGCAMYESQGTVFPSFSATETGKFRSRPITLNETNVQNIFHSKDYSAVRVISETSLSLALRITETIYFVSSCIPRAHAARIIPFLIFHSIVIESYHFSYPFVLGVLILILFLKRRR